MLTQYPSLLLCLLYQYWTDSFGPLLWNNDLERVRYSAQDCWRLSCWVAINLHGNGSACRELERFTGFIAHPLIPMLTLQEKIQYHQHLTQCAALMHNAHIKQTIIALRLPCKFDGSSVQPRIADDDLYGTRPHFTLVNLERRSKAIESKSHPYAGEQVTGHTETFKGLFSTDCVTSPSKPMPTNS